MSYRDVLAMRDKQLGARPCFPLTFPDTLDKPAQGMSARQGQDAQRLGAKPASPVPARHAPKSFFSRLFRSHPHAR